MNKGRVRRGRPQLRQRGELVDLDLGHAAAGGFAVISDPDREPVLERAMPADAVPGSTIPEDTDAEVLLRDGSWAWCRVIGQRRDRHGRWCIGIRWYASSAVGGREGWYLYSPSGIRRPNHPLRS